jgi:hypothetical protein
MAAFHFDEMVLPQWNKLTLVEKLSCYYDKTHALVASVSMRRKASASS